MGDQTLLELPIELEEQLRRGNVLLFLGQGINHGPGGVAGFPTHDELAAELASRCDYPDDAPLTLSQVAQLYEDTGPGRQPFLAFLRDRLDRPDFVPGKNHRQIARLPVRVIVTTCYDDLMERALRAASPPRSYTLVVGRVDTAFLDEEKTALVKLWGDLSQAESLVVTEDDRRGLLRNRQSTAHFLSSELIRRTWVFLGYDMADPWFRDFFDTVRQSVQGFEKQAFVVGTRPPTHVLRWWQKRNVVVLEAEIAEVLSALVSTATQPRLITPVNPYKLLESFSGVDRGVFAGRDTEIEDLLQRVRRQSLIVLFGESGTGKTSLINAGLVPRLWDEGWLAVSVRCLDEPVSLIRREALSVVQQASGMTIEQLSGEIGALGATADLAEFMRRLGHHLISERRRSVVVVDQFEEIFTRAAELQRQQLAQAVRAIQEMPELQGRLVVLFALREDYLGQLWSWAHDYDLGAAWYNAFRITRLADAQARQAIVEPARKSDAVFETDLVDQVLHDLRDIGDGLVYPPYLQVVCFALFEHGLRQRDGAALRVGVADYEGLGKAEQIVVDYLDKSLFEGLTPLYRRIAEGVLDALTGARGLRTLMSFEEISRAVGDNPARVREVIEVLVRRRVVRPYWDKDRLKGYELVHDFLSQRFFDRLSPERQQQKLALQLYRQAVSDWKTLRLPVDHSRLDMFLGHADVLPFDEAGYRMVLETAASDVDRFDRWAEVIARRADERSVDALVERLNDPQWRVRIATIKALGNMGEKASQAVEPLSKRLVMDKTWQVRKAAAQALKDLGEIASPAVDALIGSLRDQTRHVRQAAAEALGEIGESKAAEPLVTCLDDPDKGVRQAVVSALVSIGGAAISPLIQQLTNSKMTVRLGAVQALERIGPEAAPAAMALVARLGDEGMIRQAAMRALTKIGAEAVDPLVAELNGEDERIRLAVVEALGSIRAEAKLGIEPLIGALEDESSRIRLATTRALGQIWDIPILVRLGEERREVRRAAAKELRAEVFAQAGEPILAALRDDDWEVRRTIGQLLGQTGAVQAVEPLIAALGDDNSEVRQATVEALGQIKDERAVEPLIAALGDSDRRVRQAATQALGQIGEPSLEPLIAALADSDWTVRQAATQALGQIKDERVVEPLIAALGDSDRRVRQAATQALGQIRDERAVEPLIAALGDSDWTVRQAATQALGQIGEPSVEPLIAALGNESERGDLEVVLREIGPKKIEVIRAVRQFTALGLMESKELVDSAPSTVLETVSWEEAECAKSKLEASGAVVEVTRTVTVAVIQALGQIGDERAVEPLTAALGDDASGVRQTAAQVLGQIGDERAVEPFIAALGDSDPAVREAAAQALGKTGNERAVQPLIAALRDSASGVRQAAAQALGQIEDERAVEPLIGVLRDGDRGVRRAAVQALRTIGGSEAEAALRRRGAQRGK